MLTRSDLTLQMSTQSVQGPCSGHHSITFCCALLKQSASCPALTPRNVNVQGDRERALGLPSSTIRDRSRVDVPSSQVSALLDCFYHVHLL